MFLWSQIICWYFVVYIINHLSSYLFTSSCLCSLHWFTVLILYYCSIFFQLYSSIQLLILKNTFRLMPFPNGTEQCEYPHDLYLCGKKTVTVQCFVAQPPLPEWPHSSSLDWPSKHRRAEILQGPPSLFCCLWVCDCSIHVHTQTLTRWTGRFGSWWKYPFDAEDLTFIPLTPHR